MSTDRDSGLQALQSGDTNAAIEHLERACQDDPTDYQAHLYLGAAYGDARRFMDAINILTSAVHLQPSNPQARYNLGIAMERGGYADQAIMAMEQALTLQPDYPKAKEALQRLRPSEAPSTPIQFPPPAESRSLPSQSAPALQPPAQSAAPFTQPVQQSSYGAPTQSLSPNNAPGYGLPPSNTSPPQASGSTVPLYGAPPASPSTSPYAPPPAYSAPTALAQFGAPPAAQSPNTPPSPFGAPQRPGPQTAFTPPSTAAAGGSAAWMLGIVLGGVGGVIGTLIWVGIVFATKYQIGFAAIGIGILIGWMVKLGVRQPSKMGGVMAAVISFLSLGVGCWIIASKFQGVSLPQSFLFVLIGVAASYRFAAN